MSVITFGGLASGLDTDSIINALMGVERAPLNKFRNRITDANNEKTRVNNLITKLNTLKTSMTDMSYHSDVMLAKGTVVDEDVLDVTVNAGANLGNMDIVVNQLATSSSHRSAAFASKDQDGLFGTGTFTISIDGVDTDIEVDADDTLEDVVGKINSSDAAASANILHDGTSYYIQMTGDDTGADNDITITENPGETTLTFAETRDAQDADVTIDGLAITSATNALEGFIPDVTLTLKEEGATTLRIEQDVDAMITKIENFVRAYNDVMSNLDSMLSYTEGGDNSLLGDSTLKSLNNKLSSAARNTLDGAEEAFNSLALIGISGKQFTAGASLDGSLEFDITTFREKFAANPDAVAELLAGDELSGDGSILDSIGDVITDYTRSIDGFLSLRIDSLDTKIGNYNDQIDNLERRLIVREATLREKFGNLEILVSQLQTQGAALGSLAGAFNTPS